MSEELDLHDIQGNVIKAYAHFGYYKSRYVFYRINDSSAGRQFVFSLVPLITTSAERLDVLSKTPLFTTDVAFTYEGLKQLGIPELSLHEFPDEFTMGMKARCEILCDDGPSAPEKWDPIWRSKSDQVVHMLISINGKNSDAIEKRYTEISDLVKLASGNDGIEQMGGHLGENGKEFPYQDGSIIFKTIRGEAGIKEEVPTATEHFEFTDGISDPFFKGCGLPESKIIGGGKPVRGGNPANKSGWEPLETGEFLLGHKDEAFEFPKAPSPPLLARNGTYLVYRKLHQNIKLFEDFLNTAGAAYQKANNYETLKEAKETLAAKMAGRWREGGTPISTYRTYEDAKKFADEFSKVELAVVMDKGDLVARQRYEEMKLERTGFDYSDDLDGQWCPTGAHIRRVNPRGALEFGVKGAYNTPAALTNRRRIARRGLPYGLHPDQPDDDGNHGIIVMILNASIRRQFEFVQQQWIDFGNDFKLANDRDPLLGNQATSDKTLDGKGRFTIPGDKQADKPPYFLGKIPTFVETRGGDYFFVPSLTALRMIGEGIVDPT